MFGLFKKNNPTVSKITNTILDSLDGVIKREEFSRQHLSDFTEQLSRVLLFKTLFADEFEKNKEKSSEELMAIFQSKFPEDVVQVRTFLWPRFDSFDLIIAIRTLK